MKKKTISRTKESFSIGFAKKKNNKPVNSVKKDEKKKVKKGRHLIYDNQVHPKMFKELISNGYSLKEIAKKMKIAAVTLYSWTYKYTEISSLYKKRQQKSKKQKKK